MLETELPAQTPDNEASVEARPTARDVQRAALSDLLNLSRECSSSEAELEERHRLGIAESREKFEKTTKDFDYRLDTLRKQIAEKADAKQRQIQQHFEAEQTKAKEIHAARRQKAQSDYEKSKADLKKRFDHASWLADSVLEAAEVQANQEFRKDTDRQNDQIEAAAKVEADAAALVQTYGQRPEPAEQGTLDANTLGDNAVAVLQQKQIEVEQHLASLRKLGIARLLVGIWPLFLIVLACVAAAAVVQLQTPTPLQPQWDKLMIPVGATFGGAVVVVVILKVLIGGRVKKAYTPLRLAIADVRIASTAVHANADKLRKQIIAEATTKRNAEVDAAKQRFAPVQQKAVQMRDKAVAAADAEHEAAVAAISAQLTKNTEELAAWRKKQLEESATRVREEKERLKGRFESDSQALLSGYAERRKQLQQRWHEGLANIQAPMGQEQSTAVTRTDWAQFEKTWTPPKKFPETVSFGSLSIDLEKISAGIPRDGTEMALPDQFKVPAVLAFPRQASVIIETDPEGREEGLRALQMIMMKLLTQLPSGRARFTICDPVGLGQSFAGFMHLADHDEQLVTSRIWTTPEQIDQRLIDMTEHMETVIQKYLRNEYETIDEYNAQAGELAEPYRFLVFADFPSGIEGEAWRRLMAIARSGARCGVYTLILRDTRQSLPGDVMIEDLEATSAAIVREGGKIVWRDAIYQQFPLTLDVPPDEETLTKIVHKVGRAAKEASRVEVSCDAIAPKPQEFWAMSAASELAVPVGRMGATRLQYFRCCRGMAQHSLVAGKTGSGKSTLLHALITNLAMWYSPDEVEFYLIDFKKGVEFKTYADFQLPHSRAIAVESDREFGLSVLQRIDAELARRGEMFRREGVQDLGSYRKNSGGKVLPRIMLIIDEFQEFFTEDDKVGQDAQLLLDRLVRQGRAFGIHVFL
ncbi:MAG: FtsK/SpoIIIE domain-containing protein, partial [Tepidisphaeraceae bacterium]